MSQQQSMNMAAMAGGPVGGGGPGGQNIGTPGSVAAFNGLDAVKKLNTAIYDYLLRNQLHEAARSFHSKMEIETDPKKSPTQRQGGQQSNGNVDDGMDIDSKDIKNIPDDLPAPAQLGDGPFLQDWWCQFWEIYQGNRGKGKQSMMGYVGAQRQAQKQRTNMMGNNMDPASMQNMRGYNNMVMNNAMGMPNDLKRQAMQNPRNLTPSQQAQMQNMLRQQNVQLQQANQMERQGSQMGMDGPRSGSPGSGDAPSPKRQKMLEGNMAQMNQGRPGPPNQMQNSQVGPQSNFTPPPDHTALSAQAQEILRDKGIDVAQIPPQQLAKLSMQPANYQVKAVEVYSASIQQQMKAAMQANSNMNKGMPPNSASMGPAGAQGSPMSQAGMDNANGEFYAANGRMGQMPNVQAAAAAGANGGNHALQDYQMQLMLLEQQNKKRLLMARQEQDSMAHPTAVGPNGQPFPAGMSPSGSRGGDPSPNPNDMARGTPNMKKAGMSPNGGDMASRGSPQPGMMDPNLNPQIRQMMQQNGQMQGMRPAPSSHPHPMGPQMTPEQMHMFQPRQAPGMQMPNGAWQGQTSGGPPMMPGPGGPQQMQQIPPNATPKMPQGNMGPPAPPGPQNGTQPSSPAQPPAPPTPSQANKPKPGKKGEQNKKANKKGAGQTGATPASEAEAQPPTPTPATPMTPMHQNSFNHQQNKNQSNGQQPPNAANPGQQQNQPQPGANAVQQPAPDMGGQPFGSLDGADQFSTMNMDFGPLDGADVLDSFDFDSFLNTDDNGLSGFDANFAFGDSIEAGPDISGN